MPDRFLFAGPSLTQSARDAAVALGIQVMPPVARGDITDLVNNKPPAHLIVADGRFHSAMSVGHAELRRALACGWNVWGLSSLGAIRAFEMREYGMRGYGSVYQMFLRYADFQDDEVALVHGPDPPYRAGSEPLVHLRVAVAAFMRQGILEESRAHSVIRLLKKLWFADRTLELFEDKTTAAAPRRQRQAIREHIRDFDRFRIKQKDLTAFLAGGTLNGR